jgi:hypothetical protein
MLKDFYSTKSFYSSFKLLQALHYLPVDCVLKGFELIKNQSPDSILPLLDYFENTYIGRLKPNSRSERKNPRFPIKCWNLHERVKTGKSTSTNNVENWHGQIQIEERKHLTVVRVVVLLHKEQSKMEHDLVRVIEREKNLKRLVETFDKNKIIFFLKGIADNLGNLAK